MHKIKVAHYPKNTAAVALGKLAAGVKKTMSPAALKQRQDAARAHSEKAKKDKSLRNAVVAIAAATLLGTGALVWVGERTPVQWIEHDPGYAIKLEGGLEIHP